MSVAIAALQALLEELLAARPQGMSEYELLKELAGRGLGIFGEPDSRDMLGMFQRHFLLFHCLYLMRNERRAAGQGDLEIDCLRICFVPAVSVNSAHPALPDTLAAYYLDLGNLDSTGETEVQDMLDGFWRKFVGLEQRDEALAVLELEASASLGEIERQYRRLAMKRHPDRGGDPAQFQRLEWAVRALRALYR